MDGDGLIPFQGMILDADGNHLVPRTAGPSERTKKLRALADAPATLRAYAADWRHFDRWCHEHGQRPFDGSKPLETAVGDYLSAIHAQFATTTLRRRVAAIVRQARLARVPFDTKHPDIREVLRGAANASTRELRQAAALTTLDVQKLVDACGADLSGVRDRALILIGFAGALRRSELVALRFTHVRWTSQGLVLRVARSKTDTDGKDIGIPHGRNERTCPVAHLRRWMDQAGIKDGALFRRVDRWGKPGRKPLSARSVRLLLGMRARKAGLVGTDLEPISPHGLRAGFITTAYSNGVADERIMEHTRQKSLETMRGYVRRARLNRDSPAGNVGL